MGQVLVSPSASRAVGRTDFPFTVDVNAAKVRVTLSREGWPAGTVADVSLTWSDGSGSAFSVGAPDPEIFKIALLPAWILIESSTAGKSSFTASKPSRVTDGVVSVLVKMRATTTITIESL